MMDGLAVISFVFGVIGFVFGLVAFIRVEKLIKTLKAQGTLNRRLQRRIILLPINESIIHVVVND